MSLGHLGPAVIRGRLRLVSPFVYSSASCSSCSVVLRIMRRLFFVIYVLSLSGLRFVVSLSIFVCLCLGFVFVLVFVFSLSSLRVSCLDLSCSVVPCPRLVLVLFCLVFCWSLSLSRSCLVFPCSCLILSCLFFVSSWGSCRVIFGRLGGLLASFLVVLGVVLSLLGVSWGALGGSWRLLERSWGELTPRRGGARFWRRSWVGFWTHLGCQKGAKTEPKTRP